MGIAAQPHGLYAMEFCRIPSIGVKCGLDKTKVLLINDKAAQGLRSQPVLEGFTLSQRNRFIQLEAQIFSVAQSAIYQVWLYTIYGCSSKNVICL